MFKLILLIFLAISIIVDSVKCSTFFESPYRLKWKRDLLEYSRKVDIDNELSTISSLPESIATTSVTKSENSGVFDNIIQDSTVSLNRMVNWPASKMEGEVDLLNLLNISQKTTGVSLTEGPIKDFPAYKFRLAYGNVQLSNSTPVINALNTEKGFTVIFIYRQQRKTLGTLLSVNPAGRLSPWFQVTSNLRTGQLIIHYRTNTNTKLHQVYWPLSSVFSSPLYKYYDRKVWPLAAWTWLSLTVDYNTSTLRLDMDCYPSRYQPIQQLLQNKTPYRHISPAHIKIPDDALVYFRQEPGRTKRFLGSIQIAKIVPNVYERRLWQCDELSDSTGHHHKPKPVIN